MKSNSYIICGAGEVGKQILKALRAKGKTVLGFTDKDPALIGTRIDGVLVYDIKQVKYERSYADPVYVISVVSIGSVVKELVAQGISRWCSGGIFLTGECGWEEESCKIAHMAYLNPNHKFMRSLDVMITEKCSLRCRDCSNLMQYFKQPMNYDTVTVIKDMDKVVGEVDEIMEVRILGGDAFMHPEWERIARHAAGYEKVKRVVVYTNGVIVPRSFPLDAKISYAITDYGKKSKNIDRLKNNLEICNIRYRVSRPDKWIDCAKIGKHERTKEENEKLFQGCVANNLVTLVKGKLFKCPFAAGIYLLGVGLGDDPCDWCEGRDLSRTIKPAVQIKRVREVGE
jgi:organic radical activating enzyme